MRTVDRLRAKLRGRLGRPGRGNVVLVYHRIADVPLDPSGLSVSPDRFEAHMACLAARSRPCRLDRVVNAPDRDAPVRGAVAVTFDDAYADNLSMAKPVLERLGIPATVFVPSCAVGRTTPFWWDELEMLVFTADALPGSLDLVIGGRRISTRVRDDGGGPDLSGRYRTWRVWRGPARTPRQKLYERLWNALRGLREAELDPALETLAAWAGVPRPLPAHPTLDAAGVRDLLRGGLVELGSHSMTHPLLPEHPVEVQREEIVEGRWRLEGEIGVGTTAFAYPYGAHDDTTVALVREAGFERAVTTEWGAVTPASDPYRLPRLTIGDWDAPSFERCIAGYLSR